MGRTALVAVVPALVVLWNWLRLEQSPRGIGEALLVVVLGLAPALAPSPRRRALAAVGAAILAVPFVALDERFDRHFHFAGRAAHRFGDGFSHFYDTTVPFPPHEHAMYAVVLVAIFAFVLATALAVAARRPALAATCLLVGAGWPATLLEGRELLRGAAILLAALWIFAGLRGGRAHTRPALAGALVLVAAIAVSTSSSVARGALLDWKHWNLGDAAQPGVSVRYVWNSDYSGLHWPKHETDVLRIQAPARQLYWRATTLDVFYGDHWVESTTPVAGPLADELLPARALRQAAVVQHVEVLGLRDTHLPAAGTPLHYDGAGRIAYSEGGVAHVDELHRGERYVVRSYAPDPSPAALARAGTDYPDAVAPFLDVGGDGGTLPYFGSPHRRETMEARFRVFTETRPYRPLYEQALRVVGDADNPYAAALDLESWLRRTGGFVYDDHPPVAHGRPPLVDFVTRTKRGYCQHFAGAMTLMLRYLGIPSRVAVGFTSGTYDAGDDAWTVTDHDAHAWVEVWFPGWGWIPFDPTPGRGELDGSYTSSSAAFDRVGAERVGLGKELANGLALRAKAHPELEGNVPVPAIGGSVQTSSGHAKLLIAIAVIAALLVALAAVKRAIRRARLVRARTPRELAAASRRELVAFAADQGLALPPEATLAELVPLVEKAFGVDARRFAAAATEAAYAPPSRAAAAAERVRRELRALRREIALSVPFSRRLRGALALRSL